MNIDKKNIYPSTYDWIIIDNNLSFNEPGYKLIFENKKYNIYTNAIFINNPKENKIMFGNIYRSNLNDSKGINNIKGYYTEICFEGEIIEIENDFWGVSKFFYTHCEPIIISSRIDFITKYKKISIDNESVILYLLFNYNILGKTILKNIFYSEQGTKLIINNSGIIISKNNCEEENLKINKNKINNASVEDLSTLWRKSLINILHSFNNHKIGLTLTGGFDSRLILSGLVKEEIFPNTYTFGNRNSMDAKTAEHISKVLKINYRKINFNYLSPDETNDSLKQLVYSSDGLLNPFRMLRINAIIEMMKDCDLLLLGYAGSEIFRGIFPDGLLLSDFYINLIKHKTTSSNEIIQFLKKFEVIFEEKDINGVNIIIQNNLDYFEPYNYMRNVIIPMHFGEDLRLLNRLGYHCYSPYMDSEFYSFALYNGYVPLFENNENYKIKNNHYKRIDNPKTSVRMLKYLDKRLFNLNLNRGYSPRDYDFSKYYAGIKLTTHNILKTQNAPVTQLNPWLNIFFKEYFPWNDIWLNLNVKKLKENLDKNPVSEYDFIPWIKLWTLNEIVKSHK